MCGIHLHVLKTESNNGIRTSNLDGGACACSCSQKKEHRRYKFKNLQSRGPDSYVEVPIGLTVSPNPTMQNDTDIYTSTDATSSMVFQMSLRASVLQMRHECVAQPVALLHSSETSTTNDGLPYFCWNGELYQMLSTNNIDDGHTPKTEASNMLQDVWRYKQSDTIIVANILSKVFQQHQGGTEGGMSGTAIDEPGPPTCSTTTSSLHEDIAHVMKCLINAEFAFLIVTTDAIYYGRDMWGRRSLLRWECPSCGSFRIASVAEDRHYSFDSKGDDSNKIIHVGEASADIKAPSRQEWSEIIPGQVVEYRFKTKTSSVIDFAQINIQTSSQPIIGDGFLDAINLPSPREPLIDGVSARMWKASFLLEDALTAAVSMRLDQHTSRPHAAILFSGGLDSVVLAALAIKSAMCAARGDGEGANLPKQRPIVLCNVSFGPDFEKSNDRKAALVSYQTLKRLFPDQPLIFRDIVVDWDTIKQNEAHIRALLSPKETLMDVNIATALWFASRGRVLDEADDYGAAARFDEARVLLVGMGADEQLGGYGRHRKAYEQRGWEGLREELNLDQARLWDRNLGRDCRVCSDHGKEARFPYLDHHVVKLLRELPLEYVCDFNLPAGHGDKRLLRLVASRLGLDHASSLVKRAIQFGSRISHLCDTKLYGSRRRAKGQAVVSQAPNNG